MGPGRIKLEENWKQMISGILASFHPIRTENSIKRRSCTPVNTQRARPLCLLPYLAITAAHLCADIGRREGIAHCKTDRKLTVDNSSFLYLLNNEH